VKELAIRAAFFMSLARVRFCDFISGQNVCKCVLPLPSGFFPIFPAPFLIAEPTHKQAEDEAASADNK